MADVYVPANPAPPPPPPARGGAFDFMRPFVFMFDDPRWLPKILIGGLWILLASIIIGVPFLLGYCARLIRNVIAGDPQPLPEWNDLGEYFNEGLVLFAVGLIYLLPLVILSIGTGVGSAIAGATDQEALKTIGGGIFGCASCIVSFISLLVSLFFPAALLMVVRTRRFGAAFEFARIWAFISANIGNYLLAIIIEILAWVLSYAGLILLCIGVIFTHFWGVIVTAYAFAQVYRLSSEPA